MSKEDELAQALIRSHRESQEREKELHEDADDAGVYPEAHYNHYGTRGVADLYLTTGDWEGHLYELKSEAAVQNVTGANEIIRQFNQMRKYFFEGSDHDVPTRNLMFELCFTATEQNIRHLAANAELYASVVENEYVSMWKGEPMTQVTVRLPEPITPLTFFSPKVDFRDGFQELSFLEIATRQNPDVVGRFAETFAEITSKGGSDGAEKRVEYQINHEERHEGERDVIACKHRDTLEEARDHVFLEEDHWSIEKVVNWYKNGVLLKREHELVEESDENPES